MTSAIILDTETTSFDGEVMELAWISLDGKEVYEQRYKPTKQATWGAVAVHHILPEDVMDCPPSAEAPKDIPRADYWIGHNIDFDWKILGQPPVKRICTLALCRRLWPESDSHSLTAMMYFLFGQNPTTRKLVRGAHAALDDVRLTERVLREICRIAKLDLDDLAGLHEESEEARVPRTWPFGKFKGEPISAADRGYANWYRRQPDPDPYIIEALKRANLL